MKHAPAGLDLVDGATVRVPLSAEFDAVVVGSGPAGASVARELARAGLSVAVVEEGGFFAPEDFPEDGFTAMARLYRDMSASVLAGNSPMPVVQGRAVGGSSVINGAICWRLPKGVHDKWRDADPALADALPWEEIETVTDVIEGDLNILPTDPAIAGRKNELLARGAEALGLEHRPIRRNVRGCQGLGRCLQGCPRGNKLSMERSFLPDACAEGARVFASTTVLAIRVEKGRAAGVEALAKGGGRVSIRARRAVVLAASAIQTPALLLRSGVRHGPVGRHFQCHPGVSVSGRFPEPAPMWRGAPQGHEVIGLCGEGIKFEALGYDQALVATRLPGVGSELARGIDELPHWVNWGAAIRASGEGRVRAGRRRASVSFSLTTRDVRLVRRSIRLLGEMMLAAGADQVSPGVHGWHEKVADRSVMARFEEEGPLDPKSYEMATTHLFGTCRMGSDPGRSVVRPDFRHHTVDGLFVADSSVFPTNIGVNPQVPIMAMAMLCARRISGIPSSPS